MRQVTLVIPTMAGGGAERVMASMANRWVQRGDIVTIVTFSHKNTDVYPLDETVHRVGLDMMGKSSNVFSALCKNLWRLWRLRRAILKSNPDHVISFIDKMNVTTIMACLFSRVRVIISERVDPYLHDIGKVWDRLRIWTYPHCRAIVVQTEGIKDRIRPLMKAKPIFVIANPARPCSNPPKNRTDATENSRRMMAVGRLDRQKGFDLLIDAFAKIAASFPKWNVVILGEGLERENLTRLIEEKELQNRVTLAGWTADPESEMHKSDLFVLSSRFEGFPNVLLEAMACGLPVIACDCPSGPKQIVRHEIDGLVVPSEDITALSAAMERMVSDEAFRKSCAERSAEIVERYSVKNFLTQWDNVLD